MSSNNRGQWASRAGFIMAAAGSAIGLGNIWKFPYITGENGGGLFVLIYLACIVLVGIPIMMAEIMIGRAAQKQPVAAFHELQGKKTAWAAVGWLGVIAGFVILSYYIVVAGWAMDYTLKSAANFTKGIHDTAEVEGTKYRVSASLEDMQYRLIRKKADKDFRPDNTRIRAQAKPSVWKAYEKYTAALEEVNAINIKALQATIAAWSDEPAEILENLKIDLPAADTLTDEKVLGKYNEVRAKLFEKPEFAEKIPIAEGILPELEETQKARLLEARAHYLALPDNEIRDEAEDVYRRDYVYDKVSGAFGAVATDGWMSTFWSVLCMLIVILIVATGISGGIERTCSILMPMLFILILVMVVYGAFKDGFGEAVSFVFKPDVSKLKPSGVLEALGHAFFTLSLGMGAMITYGSYQKTKDRLISQSIIIALLDTAIALLACLMIFPIIFSYNQEPAAGPGLVFNSMPLAFAEIGKGGILLAILFFGLIVFAAITSAISLLEVVASYFIDQLGWTRKKASWILGSAILAFGLLSAFAADPNFMMPGWSLSYGTDFFTIMDYFASNWMLPIGGLFIALYVGWVMPKKVRNAELEGVPYLFVAGWLLMVKIVTPALVIIVLLQKVGILDADEFFHGLFH